MEIQSIKRDNLPERTRIKLGGMKFTYLYTMRRHSTSKDGNIHVFVCDLTREKVDIYDADFDEKVLKSRYMAKPVLRFKIQFICPANYRDAGLPELFDTFHERAVLTRRKRDG